MEKALHQLAPFSVTTDVCGISWYLHWDVPVMKAVFGPVNEQKHIFPGRYLVRGIRPEKKTRNQAIKAAFLEYSSLKGADFVAVHPYAKRVRRPSPAPLRRLVQWTGKKWKPVSRELEKEFEGWLEANT